MNSIMDDRFMLVAPFAVYTVVWIFFIIISVVIYNVTLNPRWKELRFYGMVIALLASISVFFLYP